MNFVGRVLACIAGQPTREIDLGMYPPEFRSIVVRGHVYEVKCHSFRNVFSRCLWISWPHFHVNVSRFCQCLSPWFAPRLTAGCQQTQLRLMLCNALFQRALPHFYHILLDVVEDVFAIIFFVDNCSIKAGSVNFPPICSRVSYT